MARVIDTRSSENQLLVLGGALVLPTTDNTVTNPQAGSLRYNTTSHIVECYSGGSWGSVVSGGSLPTITITGDATGSGTTSIALTLASTGVSNGTYTKVTVDTKGRVTNGTSAATSDLSDVQTTSLTNNQILSYNSGSSKWINISPPYDVYGSYIGIPTSAQILWRIVIARAITFPANLTGSVAVCETASSTSIALQILRNGSSIGTINFANGSLTGTFTFASQVTFASGDILEVDGSSPADSTFDSPSWAFVGYR